MVDWLTDSLPAHTRNTRPNPESGHKNEMDMSTVFQRAAAKQTPHDELNIGLNSTPYPVASHSNCMLAITAKSVCKSKCNPTVSNSFHLTSVLWGLHQGADVVKTGISAWENSYLRKSTNVQWWWESSFGQCFHGKLIGVEWYRFITKSVFLFLK